MGARNIGGTVTSSLTEWGLLTDLPSSSLHAGTSTTSALLDYNTFLTLLRGGTTVSGPSLDVPTRTRPDFRFQSGSGGIWAGSGPVPVNQTGTAIFFRACF